MSEINDEKGKRNIFVHQFNDETAQFEELDIDESVKLYELLDPSFVLLFLDPDKFKAWLWQGAEASTRMKFISATLASEVRDSYGTAMTITTVDDGDERLPFKVMVGLVEPEELKVDTEGPSYTGTESDIERYNLAKKEEIVKILAKVEVPENFKRELVLVKDKIYRYHIQDIEYNGHTVEQVELLELEEQVPDGSIILEDYTPRLLFSLNKILLTDFLRKMTEEEIIAQKEKESNQRDSVKTEEISL